MVTQLDSPDGKPRKDPDRPSPTLVETDPAMQRMPPSQPAPPKDPDQSSDQAAEPGRTRPKD